MPQNEIKKLFLDLKVDQPNQSMRKIIGANSMNNSPPAKKDRFNTPNQFNMSQGAMNSQVEFNISSPHSVQGKAARNPLK